MTQPTLFSAATPAPRAADAGPRYTPVELARLLRLPAPTTEQAAIIAAPVAPLLVVAGAGSGKTETMAARVVWLVANSYVRPEQILGLTFTRKAAGELAHRVRTRLDQLVRRLGRRSRNPLDDPLAGEPTVSTYHSYAGRIVAEHGLRAGYEPTTRLLTEASRWQLVDLLVRNYDGDMSEVDRMPSTITDAVLALAGELDEHLVDPDALAAWTGRFFADVQAHPGRVYADVRKALQLQRTRLKLLPLVRAYARRKDDFEAMDFADQLARAARVARDHPAVGAVERDRYRVVLLDEYQDTSHAQVVLLNHLFGGGHPVTAVGDPCQSIYGWRGASAGTLDRFPTDFARADGTPAEAMSLTTSWRNRPEILGVANALSVPLRAAGARVPELHAALSVREPIPHRSPGAGPPAPCTARCCPRTSTRRTGSPTVCSPPGGGRPGCPARYPSTSRCRSAPPPPCWSGCAARSRRSRRPCGRGGYRSRWSAWAGCWTPRRCGTWSAPCGCSPTPPTARRCCACSPGRAGGSGRVTWWPCTGGHGPSRGPAGS